MNEGLKKTQTGLLFISRYFFLFWSSNKSCHKVKLLKVQKSEVFTNEHLQSTSHLYTDMLHNNS